MYYNNGCPCKKQYRQVLPNSHIRFLNASPDSRGLDFYVNNIIYARDLAYRGFTQYIPVVGGLYNIKAYPTGQTTRPVIDMNVNFPPSSIFTLAATGMMADIDLTVVSEPPISRLPSMAYIRIAHLSPNAPHVDITLPNGTRLFSDVEYKEITDYIPIRPGIIEFQARTTGTENIILTVPNINFRAGNIYTIYLVGLQNGTPGLQVLIPLDGNTYLPV